MLDKIKFLVAVLLCIGTRIMSRKRFILVTISVTGNFRAHHDVTSFTYFAEVVLEPIRSSSDLRGWRLLWNMVYRGG